MSKKTNCSIFQLLCIFHGHEFGGSNPTMINALDINCNIIALDTTFNREMLLNKEAIFLKKQLILQKPLIFLKTITKD